MVRYLSETPGQTQEQYSCIQVNLFCSSPLLIGVPAGLLLTGKSLGGTQTPEYPCTTSRRRTARDPVAFWTANVSVYKEYKETNLLRHDGSYFKLMLVCSELSNLRLNFCC